MSSKAKNGILLVSTLLVGYALVGGVMGRVRAQNGSYPQLSIFMEVLNRIQNDYVDDPNAASAITGAIRGMLESLDDYGGYLTSKEVEFYNTYNPAKTGSIGVTLSKNFGYAVIVAPTPGGAAEKAGLRAGDMIESIGGATTREMNLVQIQALLSGPAGKSIDLSVVKRRRPEPEKVTIALDVVKEVALEARMLDNNIAYLRVPTLSAGRAADARKQLEALLKKDARHILLDLRGTAHGEEREAVELANLFLDSGIVGTLEGQQFPKKTFTVDSKKTLTRLPMAVLVNQATGGAAEMAASSIADNGRGRLVGKKTFGMGSVQKLIPLEDGSALLITVAKYMTAGGKEIQDNGVTPQVDVGQADEADFDPNQEAGEVPETAPRTQPPAAPAEDLQLKKAIEVLRNPDAAVKKAA